MREGTIVEVHAPSNSAVIKDAAAKHVALPDARRPMERRRSKLGSDNAQA